MKLPERTLLLTTCLALCLRLTLSLSRDGTYYPSSGSGLLGSSVYHRGGNNGRGYSTYYSAPGIYSSSSSSTLGGDYGGYGGGYNGGYYGGGYDGGFGRGYSGGYDPYRSYGSTGYSSGLWPVRGLRYRRSAPERQTRSTSGGRVRRDANEDQLRFEIARLLQSVAINQAAKDLPFYPDASRDGGNGGIPVPRPPGSIPGRPNPYPSNWPYGPNNGGSGSYDPRNGGSGSYRPGSILQTTEDHDGGSSVGGSKK